MGKPTVDFLREIYHRTNKSAAAGIDEVTAQEYASNLENNLIDLCRRYRGASDKAPPVKRVWIEKEDKSQRPIGIPAIEDRILQRAVAMLLSAIYENDFYNFSYGFREKRGAHDAIKSLRDA